MSFEFELKPPEGTFTAEALDAMRRWWERYPIVAEPDGTIMVFADEETKARRVGWHAQEPDRNDYLTSYVHLAAGVVELSVTGEVGTTRWLYEFALEVQRTWGAGLYYFDEVVAAEDILAAEG